MDQLSHLNAASGELDTKAGVVEQSRLKYEAFGDIREHLTASQVRRFEGKCEGVVAALNSLYEEINAIQEEVDSERATLQRDKDAAEMREI